MEGDATIIYSRPLFQWRGAVANIHALAYSVRTKAVDALGLNGDGPIGAMKDVEGARGWLVMAQAIQVRIAQAEEQIKLKSTEARQVKLSEQSAELPASAAGRMMRGAIRMELMSVGDRILALENTPIEIALAPDLAKLIGLEDIKS
jgi:hypothetical protein